MWRRIMVVIALALLAFGAAHDLVRLGDQMPTRQLTDFSIFYCAGSALRAGASPYTYEPLHACERRIGAFESIRRIPALVVPAPQPPYDFPPFVLLSRLPYPAAAAAFIAATILAMVLCALALARTGVSLDLALIAFALPVGYLELASGELVSFSLLPLVLAGAALAARRDVLAGVCAALVAIEPHLGLAVAISVLCYVRRARIALIATAVVMALVGLWTVTPRGFAAYFLRVLPAHAASEVDASFQYSLTYAAHVFGVPAGAAIAAGSASFLLLLIFGVWLAPRLAATLRRRELLVFFPAACAVMAGPFIHLDEMPAAIPAALAFATSLPGALRVTSAAALCLLMVPWLKVWAVKKLFLATILLCAFVLIRLQLAPAAVVAILAGLAALMYGFELFPPPALAPRAFGQHYPPGALASNVWRRFTPWLQAHGPAWFAIKLPTWGALASLVAVALTVRRSR